MTTTARRLRRIPALPDRLAFWVVAGVFFLLLFASGSASPLYGVYQRQLHFSALTLTAIFAVYALFLLTMLLLSGSLSDAIGRRPVIAAGLAVTGVALAAFLVGGNVPMLMAARALQGLGVGMTTGALGGALIDLQPAGSSRAAQVATSVPNLGLAGGALVTSALAQYGPDPTRLIWWLLLGVVCVLGLAVVAMREPATGSRAALSVRPRVHVPASARAAFLVNVPVLVATWALCGLYLSLGPSLAEQLAGSDNLLWGGLAIFLLSGLSAASAAASRNAPRSPAMLAGCLLLLPGLAATLLAILARVPALFFGASALSGVAFGIAFLGAFGSLAELATDDNRGGLVSAIYLLSYLAFSAPALLAGLATVQWGLRTASIVYCAAVGALLVAAIASQRVQRRASATT